MLNWRAISDWHHLSEQKSPSLNKAPINVTYVHSKKASVPQSILTKRDIRSSLENWKDSVVRKIIYNTFSAFWLVKIFSDKNWYLSQKNQFQNLFFIFKDARDMIMWSELLCTTNRNYKFYKLFLFINSIYLFY